MNIEKDLKKMKEGKVATSYHETVSFFDKIDLLKNENLIRKFDLKFSKFSSQFVQVFQKNDYILTYKTAMEQKDYDFVLKDDSFFQFTYSNDKFKNLRFAYYENPYNYASYTDFLNFELESSYEECGDLFLADYEQYVSEAKIKNAIVPLRYDFDGDSKRYKELIHTGSHIHMGHNNEIRLPTKQLLTPLGFSIFVLRNKYPLEYKNALENTELRYKILKEKESFKESDDALFNDNDKTQLYFI